MIEVGYELEFFVTKKGVIQVPCGRHFYNVLDAGRILIEARSKPQAHPRLALVSLQMAQEALCDLARQKQLRLLLVNEASLSPKQVREAMQYKCSSMKYSPEPESFLGTPNLEHFDPRQYRAGLHIHFGAKEYDRPLPIDIPKYIQLLDATFQREIKAAKRYPGAYRMKTYGFEYRSLPATIDLKRVTAVLSTLWV